jgi:hypothetical protein
LQNPVIILGAPRSGTTLLARILGASDEVFLITEIEPHLKSRHCPEDRSGVSDADLWRDYFTFASWRTDKPRPVSERPLFDAAKLDSMRGRYLELAGSKRLVIKNPYGLARVDMLKHMFPDALFVFSLRAPWPTIQSATRKGNAAFLVPTDFVNSLPDSLLLRAAGTWAESIEVLRRERDANWLLVRHEDLVAGPQPVIRDLYARAGINQPPAGYAKRLPERRTRNYSTIKYLVRRHPYRAEIFSLLQDGARAFGYDVDLSTLPGNGLRHAAESWFRQWCPSKKTKIREKHAAVAA